MKRDERNRILRDHFAEVLRTLGQELVPEDAIIADAFLNAEQHVTELDLKERIARPHIDLSHIRRTLRMLCELGIAQRIHLDGVTYYEHLHLDSHHDHLICVRCGRIIEFLDEDVEMGQRRICSEHGFTPLMHKLEIRGVCQACAAKIPATRSLASCLRGERVVIEDILGGQGIKHRLLALGLVPGTEVTLMSGNGPVTLEVRGSRIALGRNEAAKIIVKCPADAVGKAQGEHDGQDVG